MNSHIYTSWHTQKNANIYNNSRRHDRAPTHTHPHRRPNTKRIDTTTNNRLPCETCSEVNACQSLYLN